MRVPNNHWYPLLESRELGRKPLGLERLGRRFAFWRSADGVAHANRDRCPHLGASLSAGSIDGDHLVCPFHGFRFDRDGRCVHIPSLGQDGRIPQGLAVENFPVREAQGFIWLWWGSRDHVASDLPFFPQMEKGWRHHTVTVDWPVHYTRAIENQLDVAHLPFVHRTTIGAGGRSVVEGPYIEASEKGIRVWTTNRRDDGPARNLDELATAAAGTEPSLDFLFPGVWLLNISARFKNFIAFVPINEQTTRYYLRAYRPLSSNPLARPFDWVTSLGSRYILGQDRRVVITQTPPSSEDAHEDRLVSADRAVNQFRKLHARLLSTS
jgi:phenylpropionate dioxygenase-like ring-hydroxylating dioxygenase large terminal subunit